jgi:hypothetical protein
MSLAPGPTDGRVMFVAMTVAAVKVLDNSRRRKDTVLAQRVSLLVRAIRRDWSR